MTVDRVERARAEPGASMRRRDFLKWSGVASLACTLPSGARAWLDAGRRRGPAERRTLVLVELTGGNDGLNTFVPWADDRYHRARPTLRIAPARVLKVDDAMGFAPELARASELFRDGGLLVVQGVGMPRPDRSHFTSLDRWHTGVLDDRTADGGWIGRGLDDLGPARRGLAGIVLGERVMPRILQHPERQALCCEQLEDLVPPREARAVLASDALRAQDEHAGSEDDRRLARLAHDLMLRLESVATRSLGDDAIPGTRLGRMLADALRLVVGDVPAPAIFVRQGGFDTHARQAQTQPQLLGDLDGALAGFVAALKRRRLLESVLVVVYSEFGRRVAENGSRGTDHGSGAPVFLAGGGLEGGLVGSRPDLSDLDDGDVRATIDFRRVLAQGLKHVGHPDPARVLGAGITPLA
jgi:uncharacterized protein (DUF1501 family)